MRHRVERLFEVLEERRLLSATVVDGELQIEGTEQKDVIVVSLDPDDDATLDVRVNKESFTFDLGDVTKVTIDALGGNDKVAVKEQAGAIYLGFVVYGGDGNDNVTTASGNDFLDGGAGNDKLTGGSGDDQIQGDEGNDRLLGGDDDDQLEAGDGKDKLDGAAGDDNLDGGDGKDTIKAGLDADRVATDADNPTEIRAKGDVQVEHYDVADVATLAEPIKVLIAEINQHIDNVQVVRAEQEDENWSVYYKFGTDPQTYKVVLSLSPEGVVDLVSRQVSMQEARSVALSAFADDHPNLEVVSLFQHPHGVWDVRYRDTDGGLQTATTPDIVWGMDDVDQDQDNDGRNDHFGDNGNNDNGGGDNSGGDQGGDQNNNPPPIG